uniref:Uncharacterized protein n=1 Tax=Anopheles christyi TaxID=43041 RepID=A0A182KIA9_9DIPT
MVVSAAKAGPHSYTVLSRLLVSDGSSTAVEALIPRCSSVELAQGRVDGRFEWNLFDNGVLQALCVQAPSSSSPSFSIVAMVQVNTHAWLAASLNFGRQVWTGDSSSRSDKLACCVVYTESCIP